MDQRQALIHLRCGELAALHAGFVVFANQLKTTCQGIGLELQKGYRHARIGKVHRDPATHGAGADHCDPVDRPDRRARVQPRQLADFTLGEKHVAQRLGFAGRLGLLEQFALPGQAFGQGQAAGRLDRRHDALWRALALPTTLVRCAVVGKIVHRQGCSRIRVRPARTRRRLPGNQVIGKAARGIEQAVSVWCHALDQAKRQSPGRRDRLARNDHLQRGLGADQTRQPLGATGAGQQAELDFR
ncbi:hypothetical protein D3C76_967210 [compost metagenome]